MDIYGRICTMKDIPGKIPTDYAYDQGIPIAAPRHINRSVDWSQRIDDPAPVQEAAQVATSHYHYEGVSHALLCRRIQQQDTPDVFDDLAAALARQTMTKTGAWSKYMLKTGGGASISPELREFYRLLFHEQDPLPVVLAITTLDTVNHVVHQETRGDGLYQSVTGVIADTTAEQFPQLKDQLQPIILDRSIAERRDVMRTLAQYIDLIGMVVTDRDNTFQHLDTSGDQVLNRVNTDVKNFYHDIGLTDGLF